MKSDEAQEIFARYLRRIHVRTDRMMLVILLCQWAFAIILALTLSPYGWAGKVRNVHLHVQVAVFLGALLNALPVYLILRHPGWWFTRQVVAASQMLWSGLLIHLTGGRIETHFHVFGSLAFLAFYRDWRLLPTATVVVASDHLVRGILLPESVYGTTNPEWWRFLEHALWVAFEDIVLFLGCRRGIEELRLVADREAALADLNITLEARVEDRTERLGEANEKLRESLDQLQTTQGQLLDASRRAGMADVATSVLHNVGNVLNSVNVSTSMVTDTIRRSKSSGLAKAAQMIQEHPDVGSFLATDERGKRLPGYLCAVATAIGNEQTQVLEELQSLQKNIDHIKVIVSRQQAHAKRGGVVESLSLIELAEDAIRFNSASWEKHSMQVLRDFDDVGTIEVDRHKLFQIVMNLLSNARDAVKTGKEGQKRITVRIKRYDAVQVAIEIEDDGCGIPAENLTRIFSHGFTTKEEGHGFGLHSSACSAMELGGNLTAHSDGPGKGARFTLLFPCQGQLRASRSGAVGVSGVTWGARAANGAPPRDTEV